MKEFFDLSLNDKQKKYPLSRKLAQDIDEQKNNFTKFKQIVTQLQKRGVKILASDSPDYPKKILRTLKDEVPPLLSCWGNLNILYRVGVAVVGSRDASEAGLKISRRCGEILGQQGVNIISGYAKGVDTQAHLGSLMGHGVTTIVLSYGIKQFKAKKLLKPYLKDNNYLILSQFPPNQSWTVSGAMERNKVVSALSEAVLVIEAQEKSGTMNEAMIALKQEKKLFVIQLDGDEKNAVGNQILLRKGAIPIHAREKDGMYEVEIGEVLKLLKLQQDEDKTEHHREDRQLPLRL